MKKPRNPGSIPHETAVFSWGTLPHLSPPSRQAPMPRAKGPNVRSRERARTGPSGNGEQRLGDDH